MWELELSNKKTYNCFQFLVSSIAKHYGCDYRLMMLELWGFQYTPKDSHARIGDKLGLIWANKLDQRKQLLEHHGLTFIVNSRKRNLLAAIEQKLNAAPVAVYLDSFICPWLPYYRKQHRPHALFLTGKTGEDYAFVDQFIGEHNSNGLVNASFIEKNITSVIEFKRVTPQKEQVQALLLKFIRDWEITGFVQLSAFIQDMGNSLNISLEIGDDPISSKLIMYLKNLADDRVNFIEALNYMEELYSVDIQVVKENLIQLNLAYLRLRAYLIKCSISNHPPQKHHITEELSNIYNREYLVYCKLRIFIQERCVCVEGES